ncbi:MAG: hypothetical protein ABW061_09080 [Polyangiaceae bacterium]
MIGKITGFSLLATALLGLFPLACQPGGVGDPCTPEDEYELNVPGYSGKEVNVESQSFQCTTRVCLVNHFQGRVSCKYGQAAGAGNCHIPGSDPKDATAVIPGQVDPQLFARTADKAVYCSCRCDGDDKSARYCKCPSGYACEKLVDDLHLGSAQVTGSYCVRDGTQYDPKQLGTNCSPVGAPTVTTPATNCGSPDE